MNVTCLPARTQARTPSFGPPPLSCDTHAHIFDDGTRFAMSPGRGYTPPTASIAAYRAMLATIGIERAVIVQPSVYGTDNSCTRDAIQQSNGAWRGVAVVAPEISPSELAALDADGFRGARLNLLFAGGVPLDALEAVASKVVDFGWHVQLLMDVRQLPVVATRIAALPCHVVFDHLGHFPPGELASHRGFEALQRLMDSGRTWVKLSGGYRLSGMKPPYPDLIDYARRLCEQRPDRLLWGSDWPHPGLDADMPDDGDLLDTLANWVPDEMARNRILVDNPAALYRF